MEADHRDVRTTGWPVSSLTLAGKLELIARADAVRGLMLDVDPRPSQLGSRIARVGSRELAHRYDPVGETTQHVAALLLGLGWSDSKWLHAAGIPTELVLRIDPLAAAWLSRNSTDEHLDAWVARLESVLPMANAPSSADFEADRHERHSWNEAIAIVARRPWLLVSWVKFPNEKDGHLAVHDGAFGTALHFDELEGPTLGGRSTEATPLDWDDLTTLTDPATPPDDSYIDWVDHWGAPLAEPTETDRLAVLRALSATVSGGNLESDDGYRWRARPAGLSSDDWFSAYDLTDVFPTAQSAIESYAEMIVAEYESAQRLNGVAFWHEPLWVVHRGHLPLILFDEAGVVHLPSFEWLDQAKGRAVMHSLTGDLIDAWAPASFGVRRLMREAEHWESKWMNAAPAVVGDLLRAGAGYVRSYLGDDPQDWNRRAGERR